MRRLKVERPNGDVTLKTRPRAIEAPNELVASVTAAVQYMSQPIDYGELMVDCGAAFGLHISQTAFRREDALASQQRFLMPALRMWGFGDARLVMAEETHALEVVREELRADRPAVVAGCFPEAPWRAGLVVQVGEDGLWTIMDCDGRLHRMVPRFSVMLVLGPRGEKNVPEVARRLAVWLDSIKDEGPDEGPRAWANWLCLLGTSSAAAGELDVGAHEYLYEVLIDARLQAVEILRQAAEEEEGVRGEWLAVAAARMERLVEHLEARRPPLHSPEVYERLEEPAVRRQIAEHLEKAAELDLDARAALTSAYWAEYPPGHD